MSDWGDEPAHEDTATFIGGDIVAGILAALFVVAAVSAMLIPIAGLALIVKGLLS